MCMWIISSYGSMYVFKYRMSTSLHYININDLLCNGLVDSWVHISDITRKAYEMCKGIPKTRVQTINKC